MMSHRTTSRRRTERAGQAPAPPSRYAETSARVVIGVYSFAALLTTFAWIISPLRHGRGFTWWEVTADLLNIPSTHTLPSAITMIVMVSGLIVRKRAALIAAIIFQVLGALIATHSAFTLAFPAGSCRGPYFLLNGRYALHRVCLCVGTFPFLDSVGVPGTHWSPLVGGCGCYGGWRYSADHCSALVSLPDRCVGAAASITPWELLMHGMGY